MPKKQNEAAVEQNEAPETGTVAAPAKKVALATLVRTEGDVLIATFSDASTLEVNPAELSDEIKFELMFLGLTNKVRDSWASAKGSVEFAKGAANKTVDNLKAGLWAASRASAPAVQKTTELVKAIANLKSRAVEEVQAIVDAATDEQIAAWRKNAQVKAEILSIRAEAARARLEKAKGEANDDFTL